MPPPTAPGAGDRPHDPRCGALPAAPLGTAPGVACRAVAALPLWCLGFPDAGSSGVRRPWPWPRHWPSRVWRWPSTLPPACITDRREAPRRKTQAEALLTLATRRAFRCMWAMGRSGGAGHWLQGQAEEGLAQMRRGMAAVLATGADASAAALSGPTRRGAWSMKARSRRGCACWTRRWRHSSNGRGVCQGELYRLQGEFRAAG